MAIDVKDLQSINAGQQVDQQANNRQAKPRKRKGNKQQQAQAQPDQQPANSTQTQPIIDSKLKQSVEMKTENSIQQVNQGLTNKAADKKVVSVVAKDRNNSKKPQPQQNQVPSTVKEPIVAENRNAKTTAVVVSSPPIVGKHQQIVSEEADDTDAGIELDGSSNSGSSVKDMNEVHVKSASVSPIMAQSSVVMESNIVEKPDTETQTVQPSSASLSPLKFEVAKKSTTTKQQLAENQQVIDADAELIERNRQKKNSLQKEGNQNASPQVVTDKTSLPTSNGIDKSVKLQRRFSSQKSLDSSDGSICKVCQQHVYQMEQMLAEKSIYHKKCFRCHQCKIQLRVDNYSSHEGQVYCKAHHRQIFQPRVKLDNEDDVDIVAKSSSEVVIDDYLLHRGRLSELSFSFLQPKPEGIQKRQMIICENEPAELPKDVVRSDTKLDDGIDQLNLNLNNILEKFERGNASSGEDSKPSSASILIEKPSFNIKKTLMAFETGLANSEGSESQRPADSFVSERPVVKKLTNLNGFFKRQNSDENQDSSNGVMATGKPLAVKRSESLMMRLKKYEQRIAGEKVDDEDENSDIDDDENNNNDANDGMLASNAKRNSLKTNRVESAKLVASVNLSSLKNQWESGDINKRNNDDVCDQQLSGSPSNSVEDGKTSSDNITNGNSPAIEKNEELCRIRQQLARKKSGESCSVKNIYENAIREAQLQQQQNASTKRESSDLSALNGFSTTIIQQQLLQRSNETNNKSNITNTYNELPNTPNKDYSQLNLSNKANKLKEKFELGLITNSSHDDSGQSDEDEAPAMTKLEQIRQEKLEDLSVFTDGEIKAREARNMFQQIDRKISAANGGTQSPKVNSRSLASISASMRAKLTSQMNGEGAKSIPVDRHVQPQQEKQHQPIRLTNNIRT